MIQRGKDGGHCEGILCCPLLCARFCFCFLRLLFCLMAHKCMFNYKRYAAFKIKCPSCPALRLITRERSSAVVWPPAIQKKTLTFNFQNPTPRAPKTQAPSTRIQYPPSSSSCTWTFFPVFWSSISSSRSIFLLLFFFFFFPFSFSYSPAPSAFSMSSQRYVS